MPITYDDGEQLVLLDLDSRLKARQPACPHCIGVGVLEATDMFCGAGGSSLGLEFVSCLSCGRQLVEVTQAVNHWNLAVEAHNANFPDADHDVHGVEDIPARRFRRTPLFWASPECVNHTSCKGKRDDSPEAQRSRATFKDIVRFTNYHKYDGVIVENVVEARLWCEHEDCACGHEFNCWFRAMLDEGYEGQIVYFNSQFALPTPQSRDRMYCVFWRKGIPRPMLDFRPAAWCGACGEVVRGVQTWKKASKGSARDLYVHEWGRYGANYIYRCPNEGCGQPVAPAVVGARSIIDFTLPIERIGDRTFADGRHRPLAANTRKRIRVGWENIGRRPPIAVQVGGNLYERDGYARVWSLDERTLPTITGTPTMALVTADRNGAQDGMVTPAGGQPAAARPLDEPAHSVIGTERLALVTRLGGQAPTGREVGEPMSTITAHDRQIGLVVQAGGPTGSGRTPRDVDEPIGTVMGDNHAAMVMPNMTNCLGTSDAEPVGAVTTGNRHMLVQVNRGPKSPNDHRGGGKSLDEPTRTISGHGELGIVEMRNHGTVRDGNEPAPTVVGSGLHHGMLVYNGMPGWCREIDAPAGVVTGRDHHALLMPYYRTGVARPVAEPMGAVTTHDREALVISEQDIDDCYFRMLHWTELLRAQQMHRHPDGSPYQLVARRRNQRGQMVGLSNELRTKMIGNAVSSPVATMLGQSLVQSLMAA